jgi:hypothetical protein
MHCGMPAAAAIEPGKHGVGMIEPVEHAEAGGQSAHVAWPVRRWYLPA